MIKRTYSNGYETLEHESKLKVVSDIKVLNRVKEAAERNIDNRTEILDDINSRIQLCQNSKIQPQTDNII